ncbi:MAG: homoserine dehydrogenase [Lachnospiraceae bacterium]|nr:homoserine dehydrogenase [Lachnospiraceae bacterium]
MVNIAVLGYGTVGSGVVEVMGTNQESINQKAGTEINIKYVLDLKDFPGDPVQDKIVHDIDVILQDDSVGVVVEVMGGIEPAYTFVKKALEAGKSVVTSNKALVAKHGAELLKIAREANLNFLFEASVGGGIPIIRPLNLSLTSDEIVEISGILNGTTNYILTKMDKEGLAFDAVLKDAQEKGYAERNPEADVEGYDSCRKIAILSSLAYGNQVDFEDIHCEGITKISEMDFKYASALGKSIKLIGRSTQENGKVSAIVAPYMIDASHVFYAVNDVINGINIKGNMVGDLTFVGAGAGKRPTASAVVTDVVDCAKNPGVNIMGGWNPEKLELVPFEEMEAVFYVRVKGSVEEKLRDVENALGKVASVVTLDGVSEEFAVVTAPLKEGFFEKKSRTLDRVINSIRIW